MNPLMANIATSLIGQAVQAHTLGGSFAGVLEGLVGGSVLRIRGGYTVYDVDLAHVVALSRPRAAPPAGVVTTQAPPIAPTVVTTTGSYSWVDGVLRPAA